MAGKKKVVVAITGASGAIYGKLLLDQLLLHADQISEAGVVMSENARQIWEDELGRFDSSAYPFQFYGKSDFHAPFASGSSLYRIMIICPCSMGTLGRIASGMSDDLITRAADVMLKERRKLILVPRDTPLNLIHLENMRKITLAGGIICPAIPSFYSKPESVEQLALTVVHRVLDLAGFDINTYRWSGG